METTWDFENFQTEKAELGNLLGSLRDKINRYLMITIKSDYNLTISKLRYIIGKSPLGLADTRSCDSNKTICAQKGYSCARLKIDISCFKDYW